MKLREISLCFLCDFFAKLCDIAIAQSHTKKSQSATESKLLNLMALACKEGTNFRFIEYYNPLRFKPLFKILFKVFAGFLNLFVNIIAAII